MECAKTRHVSMLDLSLHLVEETLSAPISKEKSESLSENRDETVLLVLVIKNSSL